MLRMLYFEYGGGLTVLSKKNGSESLKLKFKSNNIQVNDMISGTGRFTEGEIKMVADVWLTSGMFFYLGPPLWKGKLHTERKRENLNLSWCWYFRVWKLGSFGQRRLRRHSRNT